MMDEIQSKSYSRVLEAKLVLFGTYMLKVMSKAALLIGINYILDSANRLNGCANDVTNMGKLLVSKYGFPREKVTVIADTHPRFVPLTTREAIISRLYDLVIKSWSENLDTVYFHFSGHGTQQADFNGDEKDGMDEGICPSDFDRSGIITDDQLFQIFRQFNPKTKVLTVFDCCHSGSILDLPFEYVQGSTPQPSDTTSKSQPRIIMLSGCMDSQTSEDAFNNQTRQFGGALTMSLMRSLNDTKSTLLGDLFKQLAVNLQQGAYSQRPVVSSTFPLSDSIALF